MRFCLRYMRAGSFLRLLSAIDILYLCLVTVCVCVSPCMVVCLPYARAIGPFRKHVKRVQTDTRHDLSTTDIDSFICVNQFDGYLHTIVIVYDFLTKKHQTSVRV